jgi:hypothetical protein
MLPRCTEACVSSWRAQGDLPLPAPGTVPPRISNVVFMGQGEPLYNFKSVSRLCPRVLFVAAHSACVACCLILTPPLVLVRRNVRNAVRCMVDPTLDLCHIGESAFVPSA